MVYFFAISLAVLLASFLFCVWLVVKDRNFWRAEYQTRDKEGRERERQLFDQMLVLKGFRATSAPMTPQPAIARAPVLDSEEMEIIDARINERVEAGIMTPTEGWMLADQARNGAKSIAEIDRILRQRMQNEFPGSVADID